MEEGDASASTPKTRRGSGAAIYEKYLNIKQNALSPDHLEMDALMDLRETMDTLMAPQEMVLGVRGEDLADEVLVAHVVALEDVVHLVGGSMDLQVEEMAGVGALRLQWTDVMTFGAVQGVVLHETFEIDQDQDETALLVVE
ncbi:hypothetical protein BBJ29_003556 [Phytophthora kernoviae]|uniref:Uncharacterized protein n=1 Tax=Phytophthora kernoviae TaxID=325452 RepID=A0A3F2S291_9STRA|nr:hypothetical protein BBJ29_003556 [Phytophthora kernoviae]RLN68875.1 hypothetical protein BBP00_00000705 [Phytophthora kernoviae]